MLLTHASASGPVRTTCDADALEKAGSDAWSQGFEQQAFAAYEKAASCDPVEKRVFKAGLVACMLYQHGRDELYAKKAKHYYGLLDSDDHKNKLAEACTPRCRLEY